MQAAANMTFVDESFQEVQDGLSERHEQLPSVQQSEFKADEKSLSSFGEGEGRDETPRKFIKSFDVVCLAAVVEE